MKSIVKSEKNPYHMVDGSPWPLLTALGGVTSASGGVLYLEGGNGLVLKGGIALLISGIGMWMRDIIREGSLEGQHTSMVQRGLRLGVILFIVSEVMFFSGFFWAFFWSSVAPGVELGGRWTPLGINGMEAWGIPLLNTLILLSSGASVTWSHHNLIIGRREESIKGLIVTIVLAVIFMSVQGYEYTAAEFDISDGVYGSTFYLTTGFHGFHVTIGGIMLGVGLIRMYKYEMTRQHHFGFESSVWYWHFVDVVWLFLFVSVYWWGGGEG